MLGHLFQAAGTIAYCSGVTALRLTSLAALVALMFMPHTALAGGPDPLVACVEGQLGALGLLSAKPDGRVDSATAAAAKALQASSKSSAVRTLPRFKLETAVGWCRELGATYPQGRKFMPAAQPANSSTSDELAGFAADLPRSRRFSYGGIWWHRRAPG